MSEYLQPLVVIRKTGCEAFHSAGTPMDVSLLAFWQWSASDLASNALRGRLAEFLVAHALGLDHGIRAEWDAYDLRTPEGLTIEVKSSAYLQTWGQRGMSKVGFGIAPTRRWDPITNGMDSVVRRQAHLYVFALLSHQQKETLDAMDLSQWEFFVLPTAALNERVPTRKYLSLAALLSLGPNRASYTTLRGTVAEAARALEPPATLESH